jgi:hypothetical protein
VPILSSAALAAGIGAAGSLGAAAIGSGSAGKQRDAAAKAGEFGQYSKFREELGATNDAFKNAIQDTGTSAATPFLAQQDQARLGQMSLAQLLAQQSLGQGPSLADSLTAEARDNALAQQLALQNSSRGGNAGLNLRQAGINTAAASQGIARSGAQAKLQEIFGAREQLGGLLGQVRGGDVTAGGLASQDSLARQQMRSNLFGQALAREQAAASAAAGTLGAQEAAASRQQQAIGGGISGVASSVASMLPSGAARTQGPASFGSFDPINTPTFGSFLARR